MLFAFLFLGPILVACFGLLFRLYSKTLQTNHVCVLVLGDLGRSPRMNYHALSLTKKGFHVDLVGLSGSAPLKAVSENPSVSIHALTPFEHMSVPQFPGKPGRILGILLKVAIQVVTLFYTLLTIPRPHHVLIQTPPAIPTIFIARVCSWLRAATLTIDWHNFGYTIMALGPFVSLPGAIALARKVESLSGQLANQHICVTHAMRKWLHKHWRIHAKTLHDQPARVFVDIRDISPQELNGMWSRVEGALVGMGSAWRTAVTRMEGGNVMTVGEGAQGRLRADRPLLLVSGTSWTPDEDFSLLLRSLRTLDSILARSTDIPQHYVLAVITGKGPMKAYYEAEDLPMKVVDMFGANLPALAVDFACLDELVQHKRNGLVFEDSEELTSQLHKLVLLRNNELTEQEAGVPSLATMKEVLRNERTGRDWDTNWNDNVSGLFNIKK